MNDQARMEHSQQKIRDIFLSGKEKSGVPRTDKIDFIGIHTKLINSFENIWSMFECEKYLKTLPSQYASNFLAIEKDGASIKISKYTPNEEARQVMEKNGTYHGTEYCIIISTDVDGIAEEKLALVFRQQQDEFIWYRRELENPVTQKRYEENTKIYPNGRSETLFGPLPGNIYKLKPEITNSIVDPEWIYRTIEDTSKQLDGASIRSAFIPK